jgi:hypothetical protein
MLDSLKRLALAIAAPPDYPASDAFRRDAKMNDWTEPHLQTSMPRKTIASIIHVFSSPSGGRRRAGWLAGRLAGPLALVWLAACAGAALYSEAPPVNAAGAMKLRLDLPGDHRVMARRPEAAPPWELVAVRNAGTALLEGLRMWGLGGVDLLAPAPPAQPAPFGLLPGERLVCTATDLPDGDGRMLTGTFFWDWPVDPDDPRWPGPSSRVIRPDTGGLAFDPGGREARLELVVDSPLPLNWLRIGWDSVGDSALVQVWTSRDGRNWARAPQRSAVSIERPLDLASALDGQGGPLRVRLEVDGAETGGQPLVLSRLRIEREFRVRGDLRNFAEGLSELRLAWRAGGPLELGLEPL